ncbi:hypothetical protein GWI33_002990 [Rhynchophorus ferrugineus]|uniref:Uncharacterized protein n=1 Tax=Rhynchophorus ferrugineus TaxID=354439 RepID=A0A834ML22_RHYFE|nr:hypothetical protein GWI33_002990 [Rhynchophorus ferrugineus]
MCFVQSNTIKNMTISRCLNNIKKKTATSYRSVFEKEERAKETTTKYEWRERERKKKNRSPERENAALKMYVCSLRMHAAREIYKEVRRREI